jgi:hypothetical protein
VTHQGPPDLLSRADEGTFYTSVSLVAQAEVPHETETRSSRRENYAPIPASAYNVVLLDRLDGQRHHVLTQLEGLSDKQLHQPVLHWTGVWNRGTFLDAEATGSLVFA